NAGLLDQPGGRKVHEVAVPRLGGFAIATAFYLGIAVALVVARAVYGRRIGIETGHLSAILAGVALIAGLGLMDDLQTMRARVKLGAQIVIVLATFGLGLSIDRLDGPWGSVELAWWLSLPLTILWMVAVINAVNLIDGLDGLAAGVALIGLAAFLAVALLHGGSSPVQVVLAAGAGGVLGFLRFNLPPSTIHMGDSGSMLLGFVLGAAAISVTQAGRHGIPPWVPLLILALPLADTLRVIVMRLLAGHPVFRPDRRHVHHRLLRRGISQQGATLLLWGVSAVLAALGVLLAALAS
ncbi:MAG TPA: MraY family glycosyltransferase, partial [Candidatus Limnocylindria bacterium]|nr:MraY family glycosyltransferase [Candidatus Limnocylindria bacterium]